MSRECYCWSNDFTVYGENLLLQAYRSVHSNWELIARDNNFAIYTFARFSNSKFIVYFSGDKCGYRVILFSAMKNAENLFLPSFFYNSFLKIVFHFPAEIKCSEMLLWQIKIILYFFKILFGMLKDNNKVWNL